MSVNYFFNVPEKMYQVGEMTNVSAPDVMYHYEIIIIMYNTFFSHSDTVCWFSLLAKLSVDTDRFLVQCYPLS